ncbi:MAG: magnesium chelatase ATPase subunit I, partial [Caldimicrobium sp.]
EILKRKIAFDTDPEGFIEKWREEQEKLAKRILQAREALKAIEINEEMLEKIVKLTIELELDGHRGDIVIIKTARALAAYYQKEEITLDEIRIAAKFALNHRIKKLPFEETEEKKMKLLQALGKL